MTYTQSKFKFGVISLAASVACSTTTFAAEEVIQQDTEERKIEVISVTAQKRVQNLQTVPIAVTNMTSENIERYGLESAADLQFQTPGLVVTYASTSAIPNFSIRGVGLNDFTAVQSSPVAIHIDDVYLGSSTMLNFALFDIEHAEVLKGPQGTLYGRNSTGGAVNFFTNAPTQDFEAGVSLNVANYEHFETEGFISGGLTDTLSARLSVSNVDQKGGPYSHPIHGTVGKKSKTAARLQFLWEPNDDFDAKLIIFGGTDDSDGNQYQGFATTGDSCTMYEDADYSFAAQQNCVTVAGVNDTEQALDDDPFTLQGGIINRDKIDVFGTTLSMNYEFDGLLLSSITNYAKADRVSQEDADGFSVRAVDVGYDTQFKQISEELRLASLTPQAFEWTVGLYISSDELLTPLTESDYTDPFGGYRPNHAYQLDSESAAIFTHNEYHIDERLSIVAGLRYTHETRSFKGGTLTTIPGLGPDSSGDFQASVDGDTVFDFNDPARYNEAYLDQKLTFDKWSWRLGANYILNDDTFIYASVSNGFKSGGFIGDVTTQAALERPYDEETLTAYEIGIKADISDTLRWNTSAFYYDYRDIILAITLDGVGDETDLFINANVSNADIYGIETDIVWLPSDNWEVRFGGTLLDTEQEKVTPVQAQIDGSELPNAPKVSANFAIRYEKELSEDYLGFFQFDGLTRSDHYAKPESIDLFELEGYTLLNASIMLTPMDGEWTVTAWVKNLADEDYYTYINDLSFAGAMIKTPGTPRTYGVKFSYSF
jgi:iron complex outermembrane receptor protein